MVRRLLFLGLILLLAACSVPDISTPAPTPEAIHIIYPSVLKPWADKIGACTTGNSFTALYFSQSPNHEPDIFSDEIVLNFGEPEDLSGSPYLAQVGNEQIVVIVNQANEITKIATEQLTSIYSGKLSTWEGSLGQQIQVWVLQDGDPVRTIFDNSVLQSLRITSNAMLAPDPLAMLESVAENAAAIGYMPGSVLTTVEPALASQVKSLIIDEALKKALTQPVIAITAKEPHGLTRELIACLQTNGQ